MPPALPPVSKNPFFMQIGTEARILIYRQQRNYENLNRVRFIGAGAFDIPRILSVTPAAPQSWVGFNYAKGRKNPQHMGLHFFVDDYQFTRLWTSPDAYLDLLRRFQVVCTPDFSTYIDFPVAVQIWNHYRKHWLGAYWQMHGIPVIPTISWSDERSFEWCFDGEPVGGAVAVSSVGTQNNKRAAALFRRGYDEMLRRLKPSTIYFYGTVPEGISGHIVRVEAFQEIMKKRIISGNSAESVV